MLYIISATVITAKGLEEKCRFCRKNEVEVGTKTCGLCRRRVNRGSRNIWAGVPRRPVIASEITPIEDGIEAGIFDNSRGSYIAATRPLLPDDDDSHFENIRRAREDG